MKKNSFVNRIAEKVRFQKIIDYLDKGEGKPMTFFRLLLLLFWFDLVLVFVLADLSPFHLVNPVRFLDTPPVDTREALGLYYARSRELMSDEEKGKEDVENHAILIQEPVEQLDLQSSVSGDEAPEATGPGELIRRNTLLILHQLAEDPGTVRGQRLYSDPALIRDVWYHEKNLYLHLDPDGWEEISPERKELIRYCFSESLKVNLSEVDEVVFVFQ